MYIELSQQLMHKPSLVKIHCYFLNLSFGNENMDGCTTDGLTYGHQHETIIPHHYYVVGYENELFFTHIFNLIHDKVKK